MEKIASNIVKGNMVRREDSEGQGHFGASREHGSHKGLDIETKVGEQIIAPISGIITREAFPYDDDPRYRGILLKGTGKWNGYEIKIFYMRAIRLGEVIEGQVIGFAQNLTMKFPLMKNHIHLEVKKNGTYINPFHLWKICF